MNNEQIEPGLLSRVRPNIRRLVPYSSARDEFEAGGKEMIFLDANENPFPNGVNRYPDPRQLALKQRLSELLSIPADAITLGNGSDELIDLLIRIFCEPGRDSILTCPPTYGMYKVWADIHGAGVKEVPLTPDFDLDLASLIPALDQPDTRMVFLCSPNNPSSNLLSASRMEAVLRQFSGPVVIDEAYIDFAGTESWIRRLSEFPNLIVLQTLSKARAMAGLRLGICISSTELSSLMDGVKPPYNISILNQERAMELLSADLQDGFNAQLETLVSERQRLAEALVGLSWVQKVFPSQANFLLIRTDNADLRYDQLVQAGLVVRNRSRLIHCQGCLRVTVGTPEENSEFITIAKRL